VRVDGTVDAETWFYHASINFDHGLGGQRDDVYCKNYGMKYRRVKGGMEISRNREDSVK